MMKHLGLAAAFAVFLSTVAFCAGGLECINEPPEPECSGFTAWISTPPGFGGTASLGVTFDTSNGNVRTSFSAGGNFPLGKPMVFWHNSRDSRWYPTGVGRNHSYNIMLLENPDEWYPASVRIVLANGYRINFDQNMDGTFRGEPGVFSRLYKNADGSYDLYTNESPDMVEDGQVHYNFGPADGPGRARLRSITDGTGTITFGYVLSGHGVGEVERIREESTGREVRLGYDNTSLVRTVTSIDNVVTEFSYNLVGDNLTAGSSWGTLTFSYDSDHNIRTIGDGLGGHTAYITYTTSARGSEFRNTSSQVTDFSYTVGASGNVTSATFGPHGGLSTTYEINDYRLVASVSQPGIQKVCYTYTPDKCLSGQTYCAVPQSTKVADASTGQLSSGS